MTSGAPVRSQIWLSFTTIPLFRDDIGSSNNDLLSNLAVLAVNNPIVQEGAALMNQVLGLSPITTDQGQGAYNPMGEWTPDSAMVPLMALNVNPQSIVITKNNLKNKVMTRGGFVVQFWGQDLETIAIKTYSGYFGNNPFVLRWFEYFKDQVYNKRWSFTQPYKSSPLLYMIYGTQILQGYFESFDYALAAERPGLITYGFTFVVTRPFYARYVTAASAALDIAEGFGVPPSGTTTSAGQLVQELSNLGHTPQIW